MPDTDTADTKQQDDEQHNNKNNNSSNISASASRPPAPSDPLEQFVDYAHQRCIHHIQQTLRINRGRFKAKTVYRNNNSSQQQQLVTAWEAEVQQSVCTCLSYRWWKVIWLSGGCRILPLLTLLNQRVAISSASSALSPASAVLRDPNFASLSAPYGSLRGWLVECCDRLTGLLLLHKDLLHHIIIYYSMYTLVSTQLTVEKYPIPLPVAGWEILHNDIQVSTDTQTIMIEITYVSARDDHPPLSY